MIRNFILLILLFISTATSAQSFINMSRGKVKNKLEKYLTDNDLAGKIQETDSTVLLSVRDSKVQNVDFIYRIDSYLSIQSFTVILPISSPNNL